MKVLWILFVTCFVLMVTSGLILHNIGLAFVFLIFAIACVLLDSLMGKREKKE